MFSNIVNMCKTMSGRYHCGNILTAYCSRNLKNNRAFLSTYNVIPNTETMGSEEERKEFHSYFSIITSDLLELCQHVPDAKEHYAAVLANNVQDHKLGRGFTIAAAYRTFTSMYNIAPDNIALANILGWCSNLFECSFQINDDIMDGSQMRYGMPCWHTMVGLTAINDSCYLASAPYLILKKYFSTHKCYLQYIEWFHKANYKTALGQTLDTTSKTPLKFYSKERLNCIYKYKSTYPTIILPTVLAMHFNGLYSDELYRQAHIVLCNLGEYIAEQNDVLDCYGNTSETGKENLCDIKEGRCSWLIVTALQHASPKQKEVLKQHFGNSNLDSAMEVKKIYDSLGILDQFLIYEKEKYEMMCHQAKQIEEKSLRAHLLNIVNTCYVPSIQDRAC